MKRVVFVCLVFFLSFKIDALSQKIGFVDLDKILAQSIEGKKISTRLDQEAEVRQKELKNFENLVKNDIEGFEKKRMILTPEALQQEQRRIQSDMAKSRQMTQHYVNDMKVQEEKSLFPLVEKVKTVIDEIAKKEAYSLVLEKKAVFLLYSQTQYDLTDRVIEILNERFPHSLKVQQ